VVVVPIDIYYLLQLALVVLSDGEGIQQINHSADACTDFPNDAMLGESWQLKQTLLPIKFNLSKVFKSAVYLNEKLMAT